MLVPPQTGPNCGLGAGMNPLNPLHPSLATSPSRLAHPRLGRHLPYRVIRVSRCRVEFPHLRLVSLYRGGFAMLYYTTGIEKWRENQIQSGAFKSWTLIYFECKESLRALKKWTWPAKTTYILLGCQFSDDIQFRISEPESHRLHFAPAATRVNAFKRERTLTLVRLTCQSI